MAPQELISYVAQQLKIKSEFKDIKKFLLESGWDEKSIDEAYQEALSVSSSPVFQDGAYVFEKFSPLTSLERTLRRVVILGVVVGLVAFAFYIVSQLI